MSAINSNPTGTYFTGVSIGLTDLGIKPRNPMDFYRGTGGIGLPSNSNPAEKRGDCGCPHPVDSVEIAAAAKKPNPFEGVSESSTQVTVDKWGEGENDSVESILRKQGYSLKEIHAKDTQGRTLIDRVASANGLKNPNVIRPGQELDVPAKADSTSVSASVDIGSARSPRPRTTPFTPRLADILARAKLL